MSPWQHEDHVWVSSTHMEPVTVAASGNWWSWGRRSSAHWPGSPAKSMSSWFGERPCLQNKMNNNYGGWSLNLNFWFHTWVYEHVCTYPHRYIYTYTSHTHIQMRSQTENFHWETIVSALSLRPPSFPGYLLSSSIFLCSYQWALYT